MNAPARQGARRVIFASAIAVALALAACSRTSVSDKDSQVVATVNDHEITVSQLKQAMYGAGGGVSGSGPAATQRALDSLVNEELLVQRAVDDKLDRDPAVVRAIESARRQILVRAYAERNVFPKGEVTDDQKQQYYRSNALLFEQRRIYQLVVYSLTGEGMPAALQGELGQTHSAQQVRELLDRHQLKFSEDKVSRGAEDLPADMLAQFAKAAVGDVLTATDPNGKVMLLAVTGITDSPLDYAAASPRITQYLTASRDRKALDAEVRQDKAVAKITIASESPPATPAAEQAMSESGARLNNAEKGL